MATEKHAYEAPKVTDYGDIDDVTKGPLAISLDDGILGEATLPPVESGTVG